MKKITTLLVALMFALGIYAQTYTFTNAGASGRFGPTQPQIISAYSSTTLAGNVTINTQGIQEWTVPATGIYSIEAYGASGGGTNSSYNGFFPGLGAKMYGELSLTAGQVLKIVVGQSGGGGPGAGSGGGGSFVVDLSNSALVVAGGGGGQQYGGPVQAYQHGSTSSNGQSTNYVSGGINGLGGSGDNSWGSCGGGGLIGNGLSGRWGAPGFSFVNGAQGGNTSSYAAAVGGFGGGGGTHGNSGGGGGGGGYSGGAGGRHDAIGGNGGGGGSFNSGTNQVNTAGINAGMGQVVITQLCPTTAPTIVCPVNVNVNNDPGNCSAIVNYSTPINACGTVTQLAGLASGSLFPIGTTTNTFQVSNTYGTLTCSFTVTVVDNVAPTITCSTPVITVNNDPGTCTATLADYTSQVTYTDNCPFSTGFVKVAPGGDFTLALGPDGSLWAWGRNNYGQFGNGNMVNSSVPIQVGTATDWVTIEAGQYGGYGIKTNGSLWAWGYNVSGQLGDGSNLDKTSPVQVGTATNWESISGGLSTTGNSHTLGIRSDGTLWSWGYGYHGQLGNGTSGPTAASNVPIQVGSSTDWASVSAGNGHSVALKTNGTLWAWGANNQGQLGKGILYGTQLSPVQIGTDTWTNIQAGNNHSLGLKSDGTLWTWGSNQQSQLGSNMNLQTSPVQIGVSANWVSISSGLTHNLGLQADGTLWTWGLFLYGQCISSYVNQVGTSTDWASINCGGSHNMVFKADGSLWGWGRNFNNQAGPSTSCYTPILNVAPVFSAVVQSPAPGTLLPLGANTITYSVTDASGNPASCTQVVTVLDNEAPSITAAVSVTLNNTPGLCSGTTTLVEPTVVDNCTSTGNALDFDGTDDYVSIGNPSSLDFERTDAFSIEAWVKYTGSGAQMIYSKMNNAWPYKGYELWSNNGNISVYLINSWTSPSNVIYVYTGTTPLSGGQWHHVAMTYSGNSNASGVNIYVDGVLQVKTTHFNSLTGSIQNTAPAQFGARSPGAYFWDGTLDEVRIWNTARTPAEIQANMNSELSSETGLVASYHFNEGVAGGNNAGITTATDATGNGNNGTLNNFALTGTTSNWVAGNVGSASTVTNDAPAAFPLGNTTVTWIATDASNNSASATQVVTVVDNEAPVIVCPSDKVVSNDNGLCGAVVNFPQGGSLDQSNSGTDSEYTCTTDGQIVGQSFTAGSGGSLNKIDLDFRINPCSLLSQYQFTVDIIDGNGYGGVVLATEAVTIPIPFARNMLPIVFASPANVVAGQLYTIRLTPVTGQVCESSPSTYNVCAQWFTSTAVLGSSYAGGNPWYNGSQPFYAADRYFKTYIGTAAFATDNCGTPSITYSHASGSLFNIGTTTVTATATDAVGNQSMCTFDVTVNDSELPVIACQADITGVIATSASGAVVNYTAPVGTDNCLGATTVLLSGLGNGAIFPIGTTTEIYQVTDAAGNTAQCSFDITVVGIAPQIVCPADITVSNDPGVCSAIVSYAATEVAGIPASTIAYSITPGSTFNKGTVTVTATATNAVGSSSCSFTVTVNDTENPVALAQGSTIYLNASGSASIAATQVDAGSSDNCGTPLLMLDVTTFDCTNVGANLVTLEAKDAAGNSHTAIATITVIDDIAPGLVAPADVFACQFDVVTYTAPIGTDNCTVTTVQTDVTNLTSGDVFPVGTTTLEYTATDASGNQAIVTFDVTVRALPAVSVVQSELPQFCQGGAVVLTAIAPDAMSYSWSTGASSESIEVFATGAYTLTIVNQYGCYNSFTYNLTYIPQDLLSAYTILATDEVHLHDDNDVLNGGIGVLGGKKKAHIHGSSNNITAPTTFVMANNIDLHAGAQVTNQIIGTPTVVLPTFLYATTSTTSVTVQSGTTMVLNGSAYKKVDVKKNATVIFTSSDISLYELHCHDDATVQFSGCTFLRIYKKFHAHKDNMFNPDNYQVNVFVEKDKVEIKEGSTFNGNIYAKGKELKVKGKSNSITYMNGFFISKKVKGEKGVVWNWNANCDATCVAPASKESGDRYTEYDEVYSFNVTAYPNPYSEVFNLDLNSDFDGNLDIVVYDMSGKILEMFQNVDPEYIPEMGEGLPAGMYMVRVTQEGITKTLKVNKVN